MIHYMKELTIQQVMEVLGMSYPTALDYARRNGRFSPDIPPRGLWHVPTDRVQADVVAMLSRAMAARDRLKAIAGESSI